jgi:hypothetical protein
MESLLGLTTVHWDLELLIVVVRTKSADKSDALQTLRAGRVSGPRDSVWSACVFSAAFASHPVVRWLDKFMESPLPLSRMHWDLEPLRRNSGTGVSLRDARATTCWFMESHLSLLRMHWDHEPIAIPLARPSDTLSPTGGEGKGEGARFMESSHSTCHSHSVELFSENGRRRTHRV